MSDLDKFRKDLIDAIDRERKNKHLFNTAEDGLLEARRIVNTLPFTGSEYEPVNLEEFAKVMSQSTIYSFMTWHREALELMNRHGFVICKKTM